jgi:hypothetical protein
MIVFKIQGKKYPIPTRWEDVTYEQYHYHIRPRKLSQTIHCFTGIPIKTLETAEIKNIERINLALAFMALSPNFDRTEMVGNYILPVDVTIQSLGQFEDLRALLQKHPQKTKDQVLTDAEKEQLADLYLTACAIYVQKIRDGRYDYSRVDSVKQELRKCSCAEVIGTGAFFLFRPLNTSAPTLNPFRMFFRRLRKLIQGLPGYRKTLDFLLPSSGSAVK